MDTRQLDYFVAVADESSFTRAALRLFAAQSTVSAGVRSLERELGAPLFDRSTRTVALTAAGAALLPEARRAIESLDRVRSAVGSAGVEIRGRLRIGTFIALDAVALPQLLGDFHRRYPLVDLQLIASPTGSTGLVDDLRHGRVDVAFSGLPVGDLAGLAVLELVRSGFVAILPLDHPLAGRDRVHLADLVADRWIDAPLGYASRRILDRRLAAGGLDRIVSAEVVDAGETPKLVAAGLGISVIPELIYRSTEGAITRPVADAGLDFTVSVITRTRTTPAAAAFLELLAATIVSPITRCPDSAVALDGEFLATAPAARVDHSG